MDVLGTFSKAFTALRRTPPSLSSQRGRRAWTDFVNDAVSQSFKGKKKRKETWGQNRHERFIENIIILENE